MSRASRFAFAFVAALLGCALGSTRARADDANEAPFGRRAANVVVLDNLAGFVHESQTFPSEGADYFTGNYFGLMGLPPIARLGYHRVINGWITVGLGVHYADLSSSPGQANGTPIRTWGFSPRVGVIFPLSPMLAVWLRAGFTYLNVNIPGGVDVNDPSQTSPDENQWLLTLGGEAQLVVTPTSHLGFTVGPTVEVGVAGNDSVGDQNEQIRSSIYGVTIGLLADF